MLRVDQVLGKVFTMNDTDFQVLAVDGAKVRIAHAKEKTAGWPRAWIPAAWLEAWIRDGAAVESDRAPFA